MKGKEFTSVDDDADIVTVGNFKGADLTCMVVGLPNCGKSTLINSLRNYGQKGKTKAARVGKLAGETTVVSTPIVVSRSSGFSSDADQFSATIRVIDTPGILEAKTDNYISQLSLAICGLLDQSSLNKTLLVDYLLYMLNYKKNFLYVQQLKLNRPLDDVNELLLRVCANFNFVKITSTKRHIEYYEDLERNESKPKPDIDRACVYVLKQFNSGAFGRITIYPEDEEIASQYFTM